MRIFGYIRVSTDQQDNGLEVQKKAIEEYAKNNHIPIAQIIIDEGVSGIKEHVDRPGLFEAIQLLKKDDILLVHRRDRIGRNRIVIAKIEYDIAKKGARIVSTSGEGTDKDDPASVLMSQIIDSFSQYEHSVIRGRIVCSMRIKKQRGELVGGLPFGKQVGLDKKRLIINRKEVSIIKRIVELSRVKSIRRIAQELNEEKIFNRGRCWNHSSIHYLLKKHRPAG